MCSEVLLWQQSTSYYLWVRPLVMATSQSSGGVVLMFASYYWLNICQFWRMQFMLVFHCRTKKGWVLAWNLCTLSHVLAACRLVDYVDICKRVFFYYHHLNCHSLKNRATRLLTSKHTIDYGSIQIYVGFFFQFTLISICSNRLQMQMYYHKHTLCKFLLFFNCSSVPSNLVCIWTRSDSWDWNIHLIHHDSLGVYK